MKPKTRTILVPVTVTERLCAMCDRAFYPRVIKGANKRSAVEFTVSNRITCSNKCATALAADSLWETLQKKRGTIEYKKSQARDYSAMGRARHGLPPKEGTT